MKVQIFSGRVHHWLKLRNVYHELEERGHDVEFLIANNAINIDPPSEYLVGSPYKFTHIYPFSKRAEMTMAIPSGIFTQVPPFWYLYSIRELDEVYSGLKELWDSKGKPDVVLVLHENNFWTKLIAWLCQVEGVCCYSFQEGLLRHRDQSTMNKQAMASEYSSGLFVWTERDKQSYVDAGVSQDKIKVVGCSHLDRKYLPGRIPSKKPIVLLAVPSVAEYIGNMKEDVLKINDYCEKNGFKLILRFHPFEKHLAQQFPSNITLDLNDDPLPILMSSRLVMGQHSTILIESILLGIPAVEYNFTNQRMTEPLSEKGLVDHVNKDNLHVISDIIRYGISNVDVGAVNAIRVPLNNVNAIIVDELETDND